MELRRDNAAVVLLSSLGVLAIIALTPTPPAAAQPGETPGARAWMPASGSFVAVSEGHRDRLLLTGEEIWGTFSWRDGALRNTGAHPTLGPSRWHAVGRFGNQDRPVLGILGFSDLRMFDLQTGALRQTIDLEPLSSSAYAFTFADVDRDAEGEVVVMVWPQLRIYGKEGLEDVINGLQGVPTVAQMDDDASLEIVVYRGVLDVDSRSIQWRFTGCGPSSLDVNAHDVDADGRAEYLVQCQNRLRAFDVEEEAQKWVLPVWGRFGAGDVDGDGRTEILVEQLNSARTMASVESRDGESLDLEWRVDQPPSSQLHRLDVADLDGDSIDEVVYVSSNWNGTGPFFVFVVDGSTGEVRWQGPSVASPLAGPVLGDLNGKGQEELVTLLPWRGPVPASAVVVGLHPQSLEPGLELVLDDPLRPVAIALVDVDADGTDELVVGFDAAGGGDAVVRAYELIAGRLEERWTSPVAPTHASFAALAGADVDGDGRAEVLAAESGPTPRIRAFDGPTGVEVGASEPLDPLRATVRTLQAADIDRDGEVEVLAAISPSGQPPAVLAVDWETGAIERAWSNWYTAFAVVPESPSAPPSLILGSNGGWVDRWVLVDGVWEIETRERLTEETVYDLLVTPNALWVGGDDQLRLFRHGELVWESPPLGTPFASRIEPLNPSGLSVAVVGPRSVHRFSNP